MILHQIVRTCSNAHVARAALVSIGGDFAADIAAEAARINLSSGTLVSVMVKEFSARAGDDQRTRVEEAARGSDQPILSGLRYILSQSTLIK